MDCPCPTSVQVPFLPNTKQRHVPSGFGVTLLDGPAFLFAVAPRTHHYRLCCGLSKFRSNSDKDSDPIIYKLIALLDALLRSGNGPEDQATAPRFAYKSSKYCGVTYGTPNTKCNPPPYGINLSRPVASVHDYNRRSCRTSLPPEYIPNFSSYHFLKRFLGLCILVANSYLWIAPVRLRPRFRSCQTQNNATCRRGLGMPFPTALQSSSQWPPRTGGGLFKSRRNSIAHSDSVISQLTALLDAILRLGNGPEDQVTALRFAFKSSMYGGVTNGTPSSKCRRLPTLAITIPPGCGGPRRCTPNPASPTDLGICGGIVRCTTDHLTSVDDTSMNYICFKPALLQT